MRRQLQRAYWIGNVLTLVIVLLLILFMVQTDIKNDKGNLRAILNTASEWTAEASSNLQDLADKIAASSPNLRVMFLLPNGIVLADSQDVDEAENIHLEPDVQSAIRGQVGEHLSFQQSWLYPSLNASVLLRGRLVLRLSSTVQEIRLVLTLVLPLLLLLFLAMIAISRGLMRPVITRMTHQLHQVRDLLLGTAKRGQIDAGQYYPELRPAMEHITLLIEGMRQDLLLIQKNQEMQRDFVDNSSHELKSPLTSIMGFAEMIQEDPDLPKAQVQEYLGYILQESQRMARIINDILLLGKKSSSQADSLEAVDLERIAQELSQSLQPQAAHKQITIQVSGQGSIKASQEDAWELLSNLMTNAIRYGRQGGWVKVELHGDSFSVSDNGSGIDPLNQERIFEKFYRTDAARDSGEPGTGLGLSIVAGILQRYGASISLLSAPKQGSCFTVSFAKKS